MLAVRMAMQRGCKMIDPPCRLAWVAIPHPAAFFMCRDAWQQHACDASRWHACTRTSRPCCLPRLRWAAGCLAHQCCSNQAGRGQCHRSTLGLPTEITAAACRCCEQLRYIPLNGAADVAERQDGEGLLNAHPDFLDACVGTQRRKSDSCWADASMGAKKKGRYFRLPLGLWG